MENQEGRKQKKKNKFHEALLRQLYPSLPPCPIQCVADDEPLQQTSKSHFYVQEIDDELDDWGSSSAAEEEEEDEEGGTAEFVKKLTRSQRKRIKKKKIKEICSSRRFVGPLLPDDSNSPLLPDDKNRAAAATHLPQGDHQNTALKKLKKRRIAKKLRVVSCGGADR